MFYWDIWKILGMVPTKDKEAIRKAYAAKTREIHPEERAEAFKRLHEAYREALSWADYYLMIERKEAETGRPYKSGYELADEYMSAKQREAEPERDEERAEEAGLQRTAETAGGADLVTYFTENQERLKQRVDAFVKYWREMKSPFQNPEVLAWWKEYLVSETFQDIRYQADVLSLIAGEIDDKFFYGINEIKLLFWDAYGFQEEENIVYPSYQGDVRRLYKSLYPAYEERQRAIEEEQNGIKRRKITRVIVRTAAAAVLAIVIFSSFNTYRRGQKERGFLIDYMARQYPETTFSEPERLGRNGFEGGNVYTMRSLVHPELSVTAEVTYKYFDGKKTCLVTENYGQLLFAYYAGQYGLAYEWMNGNNVLVYEDIEEIEAVCAKAEEMFREQEELQKLPETAFYTERVLFPEILLIGGIPDQPFADAQIYDISAMTAQELAAALQKAYMCYMFQYEPWNITTQQYREWGAAYEKICEGWEDDDGEWYEVYDPDTGERLCRLLISTYKRLDTNYSHGTPAPIHTRMMTAGNAYYFLLRQGADLDVDEDGSGFYANFLGTRTWFGFDPEVKFDDLRHCY